MRKHSLGILLLWALLLPGITTADDHQNFQRLYSELLSAYWHDTVTINNIETTVFDYRAMAENAKAPESLFVRTRLALRDMDPDRLTDPDQAMAFWINAYNFGAIALVFEHYPVDSIRSFKISLFRHPWSREVVNINGRGYSLSEIEHDILIKQYRDPRIVFAVSCAAVSCPDRTPEPFAGERLDAQMDATIRHFFANPGKGLRLDWEAGELHLSWILKKDRALFDDYPGGVTGFVRKYAPPDIAEWLAEHEPKLHYLSHDWTLNDLEQSR